jgi:glycerol-3-phosphate cytidylyltransferase
MFILYTSEVDVVVLYTGGTFDLFHFGHVRLLKKCKEVSDKVVVALNTDSFVMEYKGLRPVIDFEGRKEMLLSCRYVDEVVANSHGKDSKPTILKVNPDIIAVGDDWKDRNYHQQMGFSEEWLERHCIQLMYLDYTKDISSTKIRGLINE